MNASAENGSLARAVASDVLVPLETATAALLGVAVVLAGVFVFCLGLLALAISAGLWLFGLVLLPFALVVLVLGFVCLAVAYAFARTLVVATYRRGRYCLSNDSGSSPANAPVDPS